MDVHPDQRASVQISLFNEGDEVDIHVYTVITFNLGSIGSHSLGSLAWQRYQFNS